LASRGRGTEDAIPSQSALHYDLDILLVGEGVGCQPVITHGIGVAAVVTWKSMV
jgi:hypothetical protein